MSKNKSKKKKPLSGLPASKRTRGLQVYVVVAGVALVFVAAAVIYVVQKNGHEQGQETVTTQAPAKANETKNDINKLVGRWLRPDGDYVIEIRDVRANGDLDLGYFNPLPINVSKAKAAAEGEQIEVFIELYDEGYPGSTYTLTYDARSDAFVGTYFQAVIGQSFDVVFVRMK